MARRIKNATKLDNSPSQFRKNGGLTCTAIFLLQAKLLNKNNKEKIIERYLRNRMEVIGEEK